MSNAKRTEEALDEISRLLNENSGKLDREDLTELHDVEVGDRVRSYDFPENINLYRADEGRRVGEDCFVEGVVTGVVDHPSQPCQAYRIKVERRIFGGEERAVEDGEIVHAPLNGTPKTMGGVTFGVIRVEDEAEEEADEDSSADQLDISEYKTAAGAAKAVARRLREEAEEIGQSADEVVVRRPEDAEFDNWHVIWEGGPFEWAQALCGGASIYCHEFPQLGAGTPQVVGEDGLSGEFGHAEPGYSFSLSFCEW